MESLLTAIGRPRQIGQKDESGLIEIPKKLTSATSSTPKPALGGRITTLEEGLEVLKNEPDYNRLVAVLQLFTATSASASTETQHRQQSTNPRPNALATRPTEIVGQVIHVLVSQVLRSYWPVLKETPDDKMLLVDSLRSIAGLSTLVTRLKVVTANVKGLPLRDRVPDSATELQIILEVLATVLEDEFILAKLWDRTSPWLGSQLGDARLLPDFFNTLATTNITALALEAEDVIQESTKKTDEACWTASRGQYAKWLVRSVVAWLLQATQPEEFKLAGNMVVRSYRIWTPGMSIPMTTALSDLWLIAYRRGH